MPFQKGVSGNPGGIKKKTVVEKAQKDVRELAASRSYDIMQESISIALDRSIDPSKRYPYINMILNQGLGRLPQPVKLDVNADVHANLLTSIGELFAPMKGTVIEAEAIEEQPEEGLELPQAADLAMTLDTE